MERNIKRLVARKRRTIARLETEIRELEEGAADSDALYVEPFDGEEPFYLRVGDRVLTKYGDRFTVKGFDGAWIQFEESDRPLTGDRLVYKLSGDG